MPDMIYTTIEKSSLVFMNRFLDAIKVILILPFILAFSQDNSLYNEIYDIINKRAKKLTKEQLNDLSTVIYEQLTSVETQTKEKILADLERYASNIDYYAFENLMTENEYNYKREETAFLLHYYLQIKDSFEIQKPEIELQIQTLLQNVGNSLRTTIKGPHSEKFRELLMAILNNKITENVDYAFSPNFKKPVTYKEFDNLLRSINENILEEPLFINENFDPNILKKFLNNEVKREEAEKLGHKEFYKYVDLVKNMAMLFGMVYSPVNRIYNPPEEDELLRPPFLKVYEEHNKKLDELKKKQEEEFNQSGQILRTDSEQEFDDTTKKGGAGNRRERKSRYHRHEENPEKKTLAPLAKAEKPKNQNGSSEGSTIIKRLILVLIGVGSAFVLIVITRLVRRRVRE